MSVRDVGVIGAILFVFVIGFFVLHFVMNIVVDDMVMIDEINNSVDAVNSFNSIKETVNRLDYLVFMLFIGLVLALIISSYFIAGNIIFMFIYFLVLVVTVIVSTILSNAWQTVSLMPEFGATVFSFPISNNLLTYLPIYISVIGFIGIVVMFAKPYFQGGME